jgi:hypothetical protein
LAANSAEQQLWDERLLERTNRLAKLAALGAPSVILCEEWLLVTKALAGFAPEQLGNALGRWLQEQARIGMQLCVLCGEDASASEDPTMRMCPKCEAEIKTELDTAETIPPDEG